MTNSKLILIILILAWVLFGLLHIEKQKDNKMYVIATVDVYHHIAKDEPVIETVPEDPKPQPLIQQAHAESKPVVSKKETVAQPPKNPQRITKKWFESNKEMQDLVNYAYKIGGKDFLLTMEWENGLWKWDRKSGLVGSNGYSDYGLCQLNAQYHGKWMFANGSNPKDWFSKEFQDPYKQIDYCCGVFQDGLAKGRIHTTFYAYNKRHDKVQRFDGLQ